MTCRKEIPGLVPERQVECLYFLIIPHITAYSVNEKEEPCHLVFCFVIATPHELGSHVEEDLAPLSELDTSRIEKLDTGEAGASVSFSGDQPSQFDKLEVRIQFIS
jgi:hypothetical protein